MTIQEEIPENETQDNDIEIHGRESRYTPKKPKKNGQRERIWRFLHENPDPHRPYLVASKTGIPPGSCRRVMLTMYKNGLIRKDRDGYYFLKPIDGMGGVVGVKPRVQNLWVVAGGVDGVPVGVPGPDPDAVLESMFCCVRLWWGGKRGQVSYHVAAPLGLDPVGLSVVVAWVDDVCRAEGLVVPVGDWVCPSYELFVDDESVRLHGVEGITISGLAVGLVKWYNKPCSRREWRPSHEADLDGMFRFMSGTVGQAEDRVQIDGLKWELVDMRETMKYLNETLGRLQGLVNELLGRAAS